MMKKRKRNIRKRTLQVENDDEEPIVGGVEQEHSSKISKPNPLIVSSADGKERRIEKLVFHSSGTGVADGPADQGATRTVELDTAFDRDRIAIEKRNQSVVDQGRDGIYHGQSAYKHTIKNKYGPMRAPTNIRVVNRMDFQPDICKDYKETGYCGFGDSCKFLHDRGDYKMSWELDRDWDANKANAQLVEEESDSDSDNDIPFACFVCRKPYTNPVVTKCEHYFCETCALKKNKEMNGKCFVCEQPTHGIFNIAKKIIEKKDFLLAKYNAAVEEGGEGEAGEGEGEAGEGEGEAGEEKNSLEEKINEQ